MWFRLALCACCASWLAGCGDGSRSATELEPFASNNGEVPSREEYDGPLFRLSFDYPRAAPPRLEDPPWRAAIDGEEITVENAHAYVLALKEHIAADMRTLILDYPRWDADERGWYNQPWLASIRESIHGTYEGSEFSADTFSASGLSVDITTYVLPYYDRLAGFTVGAIWQGGGLDPDLSGQRPQFADGAIIVKLALQTASPDEWPAMEGAASWPLFIDADSSGTATVTPAYLFQLDIIVKDSASAPQTKWVFSTLVHDKDVPGDAWDKLVPLGAMWGNDPDVDSTTGNPTLEETYINPDAPPYSKATLGWGGRLSGPNDGAVLSTANIDGEIVENLPASSCMSCHGIAEYELESSLLPGPSDPERSDNATVDGAGNVVAFAPGSAEWMRWFQSRSGDVAQDPGTVALDYDMVTAFKALPAWETALGVRAPSGRRRPYRGIEPEAISQGP